MEHNKAASSFVVQIVHLLEVDRSGEPRFSPAQILAVTGSIDEARSIARRFPKGPTADVQILEVVPPVDVGGLGLRFLTPIRRAVIEPKAKPVRKACKAA